MARFPALAVVLAASISLITAETAFAQRFRIPGSGLSSPIGPRVPAPRAAGPTTQRFVVPGPTGGRYGAPGPMTQRFSPTIPNFQGMSAGGAAFQSFLNAPMMQGGNVGQDTNEVPEYGAYQPQQGTYYQPQQGTYYQQPSTTYYQPAQGTTYTPSTYQRYQIPAGYESYAAGSVINYGGASYVIGGDGTMSPSSGVTQAVYQPSSPQRYQIPAGYESYRAGSVLSYGGANYLVGSDGTMTPYAGTVPVSTTTEAPSSGPVAGQRYQIPAAYANASAGSIVNYGGTKYLINNDSTMTALSAETQRSLEKESSNAPTPGKRYQVPSELAGSRPGSVVKYGSYEYIVNDDGTMTAMSK